MDEEKMYKDAEQRICNSCSLHSDCAWVIRGLESKCSYLSDVMYGYEVCQEDMKKDALDRVVKVDAGGYPYIDCKIELYDYDKDEPLAKEGDKVKVIILKEQ